MKTFYVQEKPIASVLVCRDNRTLITGCEDNTIRFWDIASATLLVMLGGHCDYIRKISLNFDESKLASGGKDKICMVWDLLARSVQEVQFDVPIRGVRVFENTVLQICYQDNTVRSFDFFMKQIDSAVVSDQLDFSDALEWFGAQVSFKDSSLKIVRRSPKIAWVTRNYPLQLFGAVIEGVSGLSENNVKLWQQFNGM